MEGFNSYEFSCEQKSKGKWLAFKLLLVLLYIAFAGAYFLIVYITRFFPVGALIPVALWILIHFTWRYANPDYTYTIEGGVFNYYRKFRHGKPQKKASFKISDAHYIGPLRSYDGSAPKNVYSALPESRAEDAYIAVFGANSSSAIKFVATRDALRMLKRHNPNTVITETKS